VVGLASDFSEFPRLPRAELEVADLGEFLHDLSDRPLLADDERKSDSALPAGDAVARAFDLPKQPRPARIDRQMLRRVLINLVRNAVQAVAATKRPGHVRVQPPRAGDFWHLDIDAER